VNGSEVGVTAVKGDGKEKLRFFHLLQTKTLKSASPLKYFWRDLIEKQNVV